MTEIARTAKAMGLTPEFFKQLKEKKVTGGRAYPRPASIGSTSLLAVDELNGMTKLEHYAGLAMQACLSACLRDKDRLESMLDTTNGEALEEKIANVAFSVAGFMVIEIASFENTWMQFAFDDLELPENQSPSELGLAILRHIREVESTHSFALINDWMGAFAVEHGMVIEGLRAVFCQLERDGYISCNGTVIITSKGIGALS